MLETQRCSGRSVNMSSLHISASRLLIPNYQESEPLIRPSPGLSTLRMNERRSERQLFHSASARPRDRQTIHPPHLPWYTQNTPHHAVRTATPPTQSLQGGMAARVTSAWEEKAGIASHTMGNGPTASQGSSLVLRLVWVLVEPSS